MQSTLLGVAIIIILALLAALVGPFFIDWNNYRSVFEAEASRLVGLPVRVSGAIDARMLPTPSLTLNGIEIGAPGERRVSARSLEVEFALGPLMRGNWRAAELRLVGPEFNLGLDGTGRIDWPSTAIGVDRDALSIERLTVEGGHAILTDVASGARATLEKLWFRGELRSLIGPIKGEGAFIAGGELYAYRLTAGRFGENSMKLRLALDPSDQPLTIEADGILALERGAPRFEGLVSLARIAGVARPVGEIRLNDPWRVTSRIKATSTAALLDQLEVQYGPEERALRLGGTAELKFHGGPRFEGMLFARQLDFDRAFPHGARRLPLVAIRTIAETFGPLRAPIPMQLGLAIDTMTLAGGTLQSVRGDLRIDAARWELDKFELRAPGLSHIQLSGRLDFTARGSTFTGPVRVEANDPSALIAWIEGRSETPQAQAKAVRLQGEATFGEKIAIERLKVELDRETIEGRLAYQWASEGQLPRLEAELRAPKLDVDAAIAFAKAALAGTSMERPGEIALTLDLGQAGIAGFSARDVQARLRVDAGGVQVERIAVGDFGGAAFAAQGRIETAPASPRGSMNIDLDARELAPVTALLATVAPQAADWLRYHAQRLAPAKLRAWVTISTAAAPADTNAEFGIEGRLGGMRVNLTAGAVGNAADPLRANLRVEGRLESDHGGFLVALLGIDKIFNVDRRPGRLSFSADGPLTGDLRIDGRLSAGGLDLVTGGSARLVTDQGPSAALRVAVTGDVRSLRGAGRPSDPLLVVLKSQLSLAGNSALIEEFSGTIAETAVRGKVDLDFGQALRIEGDIQAQAIDGSGLLATVVGMPAAGGNAWPSEPFAPGLFGDFGGRVGFKVGRAALTPSLTVRDVRGVLRLGRGQIALDDIEAELAGGPLTGQLELRTAAEGLTARGRVALTAADAAAIIPAGGRPPIAGRLTAQVDAEGTGRSPAALFGSLSGGGTMTLEGAQLAGLDTKAFDVAIRAADQDLTIDMPRIGALVSAAFDSGRLGVPQLDGAITIRAGQARLAQTIARADDAELAVAGHFDLGENIFEARLTLSSTKIAPITGGGRPEVFIALKGPIAAAKRALDVSALVSWLTLRAADQQASLLEAIESARKSSLESAAPAPPRANPPLDPLFQPEN